MTLGNFQLALILMLLTAWIAARADTFETGDRLGVINFATSCNEPAQQEFNRAVALLHSFQFSRAIEGFNSVLRSDPTCGIAYWGMALSDWSNPFATGLKDSTQLESGRRDAAHGK